MNILILTNHLNKGGLTRYIISLTGTLSKRHNIHVGASGGDWQDRVRMSGGEFYPIPIKTKSILSPKIIICFFKLLPFLVKHKIDVICANTRVTQFLAYLIYRACGIPYVSVYHGFYGARYERKLLKFQGVHAIAVSKAVKVHLVKNFHIPAQSISVIHNGIDSSQFTPKGEGRSQSKDFLRLGILGRVSAEKGHLLVIETVRELLKEGIKVTLSIAGDGKLKGKIQEYIAQFNLAEQVQFVSMEAEEFLDTIDILIVASSKEGFGYIILEAFAKEVPVIAYAVGGIKEIIVDKENGILFYEYNRQSLKEAIKVLVGNPEFKKQLIENAKRSLGSFTLGKMVDATEEVLRGILR